MDAALGPPDKMEAHSDELTPMMSQYFELCREYDECLVLFQVGDFYETFCEAAETTSRLLEIALTKREDNTGEYPMSGIPIDNAESYIETLLDAGYRVAVADQVEDPEEATGVVERAVTRIVTPGTLTEDELLETDDNNYVACLTRGRESATPASDGSSSHSSSKRADEYGLAVLDVSTGEFFATSVGSRPALRDEIGRFASAEAIVEPDVDGPSDLFDADTMVTAYDETAFDADGARERVASYFGPPDRLLATDAEVRACGALLAYAEYTRGGQDGRLDYLNHLTRYDPREYMLLDAVALRSLELFEPRAVRGDRDTTLVGILDETACALGSRELKDWLRRPLLDRDRIGARLDAVEEWTTRLQARERVHDLLRDVYDIERLIGRISRGRANARDLRSLKRTLDVVPDLRDAMADVESSKLLELRSNLDELTETRDLIDRAISEDPPAEITEGGIIKPGYSEELDDLRETERAGKEWIDSLEAHERDRTGIDSLKVGYNSVHGYYIEVTKPNLDRVPDDYTRRQTLKNAERFYTPELKQREDEIIRAEQRADTLEHQLFADVRSEVAAESERIQALADALAELDVLVALADAAAKHDYVRPEVGDDGIDIRDGRHPVVERTQESFVPNDTQLDSDSFFAIVTGPNMSGKSTYMRQVALITILAQMGSFVPAAAASIEITDRVFTRVGASDDIAGGKSTFMVEMVELAEILDGATERSLVLLDEVGRGTSTTDGLAIARAITEYIHDEIGAKTLFATHHHELTAVADNLDGVVNRHFDAHQDDGEVVFDHDLSPGTATASYGIEVARAAGVPDRVVRRSRALIADEETGSETEFEGKRDGCTIGDDPGGEVASASDNGTLDPGTRDGSGDGPEAGASDVDPPPSRAEIVAAELRETNIAETTPIEALTLLNRLKRTMESNTNDDE